MSLEDYGWDAFFETAFESLASAGEEPARVLLSAGGSCRLHCRGGEISAGLAGRMRYETSHASGLPAVGDWVGFSRTSRRVLRVLPRRSTLSRKVAGTRTEEQVVAANVDRAIIVMGLDADYNLRRLERLVTTVWESGASPVVLLNKSDLADDPESRRNEAREVAPGVPVLLSSCHEEGGIEEVHDHLRPRETAVLVGSSGVGKSSLMNRLLEGSGSNVQRTQAVRKRDGRGRHTTTYRELFALPGGALLIDNPGIRELQLWSDEESLDRTFDDIASLAVGCRFHDCTHGTEPGCAVVGAVSEGSLGSERLQSYRALQKELRYLALRQDESAQRVEKRKWRAIHREMRRSGRHRRT
jgi:ribosome biogenesis GTPase